MTNKHMVDGRDSRITGKLLVRKFAYALAKGLGGLLKKTRQVALNRRIFVVAFGNPNSQEEVIKS
jgi:hypothetical protein